jgi:uncharacterized protein involved in exopolysaccharide biosynthesis
MDSASLTFPVLVAGMLARWRAAAAVMAATVLIALVLSLVLPPTYRSVTSFVTADAAIQLPQGLADLASEPGLSGIASQMGIGTGKDPSVSPAFYAQLLDSRELLTRVVRSRFPDPRTPGDSGTLVDLFRIRSTDPERAVEDAVKKLRRMRSVGFDPKTGLVVMQVEARWPALSADIANRAVSLVSAFNREQRFSRARAKREFLESRVAEAQVELRGAEDSLQAIYDRNRLWASSPALVVEERRRRRQVETASTMYLTLRQQHESARIDEVNNTPVITVVDAAILGAGLAVLWTASRELASHWARNNPEQADLLRSAARRAFREIASALPGPKRPA